MAALGLVFILISKNLLLSLSSFFLLLTIFFMNGLSPSNFFKIILSALLFSFGFFLLSQVYPAKELKDIVLYKVGFLFFTKPVFATDYTNGQS